MELTGNPDYWTAVAGLAAAWIIAAAIEYLPRRGRRLYDLTGRAAFVHYVCSFLAFVVPMAVAIVALWGLDERWEAPGKDVTVLGAFILLCIVMGLLETAAHIEVNAVEDAQQRDARSNEP